MQKVYRRKLSSGRMGYIVRALPKSTTSEVKCTAFPLSLVPLKNKGITRSGGGFLVLLNVKHAGKAQNFTVYSHL